MECSWYVQGQYKNCQTASPCLLGTVGTAEEQRITVLAEQKPNLSWGDRTRNISMEQC